MCSSHRRVNTVGGWLIYKSPSSSSPGLPTPSRATPHHAPDRRSHEPRQDSPRRHRRDVATAAKRPGLGTWARGVLALDGSLLPPGVISVPTSRRLRGTHLWRSDTLLISSCSPSTAATSSAGSGTSPPALRQVDLLIPFRDDADGSSSPSSAPELSLRAPWTATCARRPTWTALASPWCSTSAAPSRCRGRAWRSKCWSSSPDETTSSSE